MTNVVNGTNGNDVLNASGTFDSVYGGAGNDTLVSAGNGLSYLFGGQGADVFKVTNLGQTDVFAETYFSDFNRSEGDKIDLSDFKNISSVQDIFVIADLSPKFYILDDNNLTFSYQSLQNSDFIFYTPPSLSIQANSPASLAEGDSGSTSFTFTVTRDGTTNGVSTVNWSVQGSNHAAGNVAASDFQGNALPSGTLTFAAGETSKIITVQVAGDSAVELNEGFQVVLSNLTGGGSIATASAQATILNDDTLPTLSIAAPAVAEQAEGDAASTGFTFTVTREGNVNIASSVNWSVQGGTANAADFAGGALPSGSLSFAIGETSKTITIDVAGDTRFEGNESFEVVLSDAGDATIATASAQAIILNDDALPSLSIAVDGAGTVTEGNAGTSGLSFTITRAGDLNIAGSVDWAVQGGTANAADFAGGILASGSVSFAEGEASKVITIDAAGDLLHEADETFSVSLSNAVNGTITTASAQGVIVNDDPLPSLSISTQGPSSRAEGNTGATAFTFAVTRSGDTSGASSVNWAVGGAAVAAADFVGGVFASGSLAFAAGESTKEITVLVAGDTQVEANEQFEVRLSNAQGAILQTDVALATILNDDVAPPPPVLGRNINGTERAETLRGTTGNDTILGFAGNDIIYARAGDDSVDGGTGNDLIYGEDGNDLLIGGAGNDTIHGGNQDDTIEGGDGDDLLLGSRGSTVISGGLGNDIIRGGDADDTIDGGDGNDIIFAGRGNDQVTGGAGNDLIYGQDGDDLLRGGTGNDTINGGLHDDTIEGGDGDDRLYGSRGSTVMFGGTGNDLIRGGDANDTIEGGDGNDNIAGGHGDDSILGGIDNDTINGGDANDTIDGGEGNDVISGGFGKDLLFGGTGNDTISGSLDEDTIYGGEGNDLIISSSGDDFIFGGTGNDTISGSFGDDYLEGNEDNDLIRASNGNDQLIGGTGNDSLYGDNGNDTVIGGDGNDSLFGSNEHDLLIGGEGNDSLSGGAGNDRLIGGGGRDALSGSSGADIFVWQNISDTSTNASLRDTIIDFRVSDGDRIDLSALGHLMFAGKNFAVGGVASVTSVASSGQTIIGIDIDGDRIADGSIALNGTHNLTGDHFLF